MGDLDRLRPHFAGADARRPSRFNAGNYWNSVIEARSPMNCCTNSSVNSMWKRRGSPDDNRDLAQSTAGLGAHTGFRLDPLSSHTGRKSTQGALTVGVCGRSAGVGRWRSYPRAATRRPTPHSSPAPSSSPSSWSLPLQLTPSSWARCSARLRGTR